MATINITDIVSGTLEGTGTFDVLMNGVERHIDDQYAKGRIAGEDYANVYLGAIQAVLQQSIAYQLGVQQADKQADLIAEQINLTTEQTANQVQQTALVTSQKLLADSQELKVDAEKNLVDQQLLTEIQQTLDVTKNTALKAEQITSSIASTARNDSIATAQIAKMGEEENLLAQKVVTETAQTVDGTVTGLIGKQKTLYQNQADGFTRNAEQKAVKAFTDVWTIAKSTTPDDVELALPLNVDQSSMDKVLANLAINAGLVANQAELGTASVEGGTIITVDITSSSDPGASEVTITTTANHGLTTGTAVSISGVSTMTELNGNNYIITSTGANTLTLDGTDGVTHTTPGSGGTITVLS